MVGPQSYENWRAHNESTRARIYEFSLYSDAEIVDYEAITSPIGPYKFSKPYPNTQIDNSVKAGISVRFSWHDPIDEMSEIDFAKSDYKRSHGGSMFDEIAALASLLCGIRFRVGGTIRSYPEDEGVDCSLWSREGYYPEPVLNISQDGCLLPRAIEQQSLLPLNNLTSYPNLTPEKANALIQAARLYQDALWIAESEPNLSWIMLVTALETAANEFDSSKSEPLQLLQENKADLVEYLAGLGINGLPERIANEFKSLYNVTRKFKNFVMAHLPRPLEKRPHINAQSAWDESTMSSSLKKIYELRSKALHGGIPFPAPLCMAPERHPKWAAVAERPPATYIDGNVWCTTDLPMHLHIFEYITRRALNKWWIIEEQDNADISN